MDELMAERRPSGRAFLGWHVLAGLGGLLWAVGMIALSFATVGWAAFLAPLGIVPLGVSVARAWLLQRSRVYRLYPDRLEVESGIVTRRIENLELFRVRDVSMRQGLVGRLLDVGDVQIHSTDASTPDLRAGDINAPAEFYRDLRDRIANARASRRTVMVEDDVSPNLTEL